MNWKRAVLMIAIPCLTTLLSNAPGTLAGKTSGTSQIGNMSVPFIANMGQADEQVAFYARTFGGTVFITGEGHIVYTLPEVEAQGDVREVVLIEKAIGGSIECPQGEEPFETCISSFRGNVPAEWYSGISAWECINLGEVFKGIEMKLQAYGNTVEKLFYIRPGTDPQSIVMNIEGADRMGIDESGALVVETAAGPVSFTRPIAYQDIDGRRVSVEAAYTVNGTTYGFRIGQYDTKHLLIIDPLLAATFLGGNGDENTWPTPGLAVDDQGHIYVAATTYSTNFPTTAGSYMTDHQGGNSDVVISKFDGSLSILLASMYLGGNFEDQTPSLAIDGEGNVIVAGETNSTDFPTTAGAYRETRSGSYDVFVAKISADFTTFLAGTYLGGSNRDDHARVAADDSGHIFVTGHTRSSNFPVTGGAFDESYNAGYDIFVSKFSNDLTTLLASTFLGAGCSDDYPAIALDTDGNPMVTGSTESSSFPTTPGAYQESFGGALDIYVAKLNTDLSALLASTYIGSPDYEMGYGLAVSSDNAVYITSHPTGTYPVTPGAYQTTFGGGWADAGIARLDEDLTTLVASTYIGGVANDAAISVALDDDANVIVSGYTDSPDFPVTPSAIDPNYNGSNDGFVAKLSPDLSTLMTSTFLGGSASDECYAVIICAEGTIIIAGSTTSSTFPSSPEAYDEDYNGGRDVFVALLDFAPFSRITEGDMVNDGTSSMGVSWIDYDENGYPDLYVVNSEWPGGQDNCLYRNNGDATFTRVQNLEIVQDGALGYSSSWADFDNDGDLDMVLANFRLNASLVYLNDGQGNFSPAETGPIEKGPVGATQPCWVDYDLDGDVDLFIANSSGPDSESYPPYRNFLFRNDGGVLTEVTEGDIVTMERHSYGASWSDYDNDGDPDLVVPNNVGEWTDLFRNDGNGEFTRVSTSIVCNGITNGGGSSWADYDNDGDQDLFIGTFSPGPSLLYNNNGDGSFTKMYGHGLGIDLESPGRASAGVWADYDNDGDQDIYVWLSDYRYPESSRGYLFENLGHGTFERIDDGIISADTCTALSAVWGDYDRDGDMDLYLANYDPDWNAQIKYLNNTLYRNNGNSNHWLTVKPIGILSNRSAIGVKIRVRATIDGTPVWQLRELMTQTGARAQGPLELHVGLGDATVVDSVVIEWPSGMIDILTIVEADQFLTITEGEFGDLDGDGIADVNDNCPNHSNSGQEDGDSDDIGDLCDNCPEDYNPDQADADSDSIGDKCDSCTDTDGDGCGDPGYPANTCAEDNCPQVFNPEQAPAQTGDINCEGGINVLDVLAVVNHILDTSPLIGRSLERADCNDDGDVNVLDALSIVNIILGIIPECPGVGYKPVVTPEILTFCQALKSYLSTADYTQFMSLVKGEIRTPSTYCLFQNYPNPFNPETIIRFDLPEGARVRLSVYNILGREVTCLVDSELSAGNHALTWDASDMANGIYFYRLETPAFMATKRMVLLQ